MPTPYGSFAVYGVQSGLASSGPQTLGPFLVPFSGCQNITNFTFPEAGEQGFDIPGGADDTFGAPPPNGVWIIPSVGSGVTLALVLGGGSEFFISPTNPTFIAFDPNNIPATFVLQSGGVITVALQYV